MLDYPLISVITVCYMALESVEQTIQSVLSQTYSKIEYIIIDGGSTDGTAEIICNYQSRLSYWHSKPDRGIAHAFNLGLAKATGEWILFLNADDFLLDSLVIENIVPYLISQGSVDVAFGKIVRMKQQKESQPVPLSRNWAHPWSWQEYRLNNTIPHQTAFTNRKYFDRVGMFDETFKIAMDYELYLRGGKELRALYVPVAVSGMREGGRCTKNIVHALLECRQAQIKNGALTIGLSWINFCWQLFKYYLRNTAHKILNPLAPKINWPGRISGRSLG